MKKLIICGLFWLPLLSFAQNKTIHYVIKGKVGHWGAPAKAYLQRFADGEVFKDSSSIVDGNFQIEGDIEGPSQSAQIVIDTVGDGYILQTMAYGFHAIIVFLEEGVIKVDASSWPANSSISGTPGNNEFERWNNLPKVKELDKNINIWWDKWSATLKVKPLDTAVLYRHERIWVPLFREKHLLEQNYVKEHPDSYVSLLFTQISIPGAFNADSVRPFFNSLSARVRKAPKGREIAHKLEQAENLAVGAYAPNFTENDTTGKPFSLSSLRGKYVLVDFWASWCVPCRHEMPNVKKVYDKYKDRNFTVVGIALDKGRPEWVEAINHDGLNWYHVSALKYWQDPVAKKYNIASVPASFLLDPSGKIVARDLRGEELEKKMAELIGD